MRTPLFFALLLPWALAAAGCSGEAVCEGACAGSGGGGGTTVTTTSSTSSTPTTSTTTGSGSADGVAYGVDPVTIAFASYALSCADPDPPLPDCGYWQVEVRIAASALVPGPVDFDSPLVDGFMQSSTPDPVDPNICSGGGGTFIGDFVLESIEPTQIVVTMSGTDVFEVPSGTYVAARCP